MEKVLRVAAGMLLSIMLPLLLQLWDRRHLRRHGKDGPWGYASWGAALYAFGPFSMLAWCHLTRSRPWRWLLGPAYTVLVFVPLIAISDDDAGWLDRVNEGAIASALLFMSGVLVLLLIDGGISSWRAIATLVKHHLVAAVTLAGSLLIGSDARAATPLPPGAAGWQHAQLGGVRGITVGPIENSMHPDAGYGTAAGHSALREAQAMGANWVAITPFGRVWDLSGEGVALTFEAPIADNRRDVMRSIEQAHNLGLKVLLVPHLWVETGGWRALIDPGDERGWARWTQSYARFLLYWTDVAQRTGVEMLSLGVELRSWVTGKHAWRFAALAKEVRQRYAGWLTYSANWDDLEHTVILGELDVLGVNAFFPLANKEGASFATLLEGGGRVADKLAGIAEAWRMPLLLTEMGYTTRRDPAVRPWEWPDHMSNVVIDQHDQAAAYRALLTPLIDRSWCAGFFVWRTYADPDDVSQEAEWGFSPRGKLAELVVRDTFAAQWAVDAQWPWGAWAGMQAARTPGIYGWESQ